MAPTGEELMQRNEEYAKSHHPMPYIDEMQKMGGGPPKTAIITCVDPRVFPETLLGLKVGETFIFRTVAGHPQHALHDLSALDIGTDGGVEDVMIIYHTDCGSLMFEVEKIREGWVKRDPSFKDKIEDMNFGAVDKHNVDHFIQEDVKWMKEQSLMKNRQAISIRGYLYDIKTGKLRLVA